MEWTDRIGRRIKLRDLHILLSVVQCGSMAKAARFLSVSHPVISKSIGGLEATLGVRLVERTKHGIEPTDFGRALLKAAFATLRQRGRTSCVIWAHAGNNARFFYETMGGSVVAERKARMMGDLVPETAFGWKTLALAERSHAK